MRTTGSARWSKVSSRPKTASAMVYPLSRSARPARVSPTMKRRKSRRRGLARNPGSAISRSMWLWMSWGEGFAPAPPARPIVVAIEGTRW
jgi:hypothetical protein